MKKKVLLNFLQENKHSPNQIINNQLFNNNQMKLIDNNKKLINKLASITYLVVQDRYLVRVKKIKYGHT